jgi:hypothetical protein
MSYWKDFQVLSGHCEKFHGLMGIAAGNPRLTGRKPLILLVNQWVNGNQTLAHALPLITAKGLNGRK